MNMKFCCKELLKAVTRDEITLTISNTLEIITIDAMNQAVAVKLNYCPFCGEKIEE